MTNTANTKVSLVNDLAKLGIKTGMNLMVHSSLSRVGWTQGGASSVIAALLQAISPVGTLIMPVGSPQLSAQDTCKTPTELFDIKITPTTLGVIPETFRTMPNVIRSDHPLTSVCALGQKQLKSQTITLWNSVRQRAPPSTNFINSIQQLFYLGLALIAAHPFTTLNHFVQINEPQSARCPQYENLSQNGWTFPKWVSIMELCFRLLEAGLPRRASAKMAN